MEKVKVLFVCLGNICRSPMAEGMFIHLIKEAGIADRFEVDSAGTAGYHVGEPADHRMRETAQGHGVHLPSRARKFVWQDLDKFDYVIAMDRSNHRNIMRLAPVDIGYRAQVVMMRDYDPQPEDGNVPDPYYGGQDGFENVYQIILRSNQRFLEQIRQEHGI